MCSIGLSGSNVKKILLSSNLFPSHIILISIDNFEHTDTLIVIIFITHHPLPFFLFLFIYI